MTRESQWRTRPRSRVYELMDAWLPTFLAQFERLPTFAEAQQYFWDEHQMRPSTGTIQRALQLWRERPESRALEGTHQPKDDPVLAAALEQLRQRIREEERRAIEESAHRQIEAERAAHRAAVDAMTLAAERAQLAAEEMQRKAEAAMAEADSRVAHAEAKVAAIEARFVDLVASHERERAAERAAEAGRTREAVDAACAVIVERIVAVEAERDAALRRAEALQAERDTMLARVAEAERAAAEQYSEITRHWAREVAHVREEKEQAERALRKEVAARESAQRDSRKEIMEAVVDALNQLRDAVGGVNAIHNTHLGGVQRRLEKIERVVALFEVLLRERGRLLERDELQ